MSGGSQWPGLALVEPHAPVGFDHSPINGVPAIDKVVLVERGEKMDLEIVFRFSPPSAFGLPGDDFLVIPGGENGQKQIVSSTIDSVTGNQLLEGTLSSYREVGQGVNMEFVVGSYVGRLRDNVLFLHTNATDTDNVVAQSQEIAESLALWLSHHLSAVISASLVQFVDRTAGQRIPTMRTRAWLRARYYHVPTIERGVKDWLDWMETQQNLWRQVSATIGWDHSCWNKAKPRGTTFGHNWFRRPFSISTRACRLFWAIQVPGTETGSGDTVSLA